MTPHNRYMKMLLLLINAYNGKLAFHQIASILRGIGIKGVKEGYFIHYKGLAGLNYSAISVLLDLLIKHNYIVMNSNGNLTITPKGKKLLYS